jgi:tRNA dimethylallyltransferase
MKELHVVAGPTASGKTKYAIELAKKINGELINADARQIYKYLDIGTNKGVIKKVGSEFYDLPIFEIENSGVLIHLLSFLYPDQEYSSFEYQQAVLKVLPNIWNKGKVPISCRWNWTIH